MGPRGSFEYFGNPIVFMLLLLLRLYFLKHKYPLLEQKNNSINTSRPTHVIASKA